MLRPRLISAALFAPLALLLVSAGGAGPVPRSVDEIRNVLARRPSDERTRSDVVAELTRLGDQVIPDLFDVYTAAAFDELLGTDETFDLDRWWCSPDGFPGLALAALGELPPGPVVSHLTLRTEDAALETRLAVVRVLGALGSAEGLDLLLAQAAELRGANLRYNSVRIPLEQSLVRIAQGDPAAVRALGELAEELDAEVLLL